MKFIYSIVCWVTLTVSSICSAELIDRKPVADGAEVALEFFKDDGLATYYQFSYRTPSGINWVFYQDPVSLKGPEGNVVWQKNVVYREISGMKFSEEKVSLFLFDMADCVIVTLDLNSASPQMHEDRFYDVIGNGEIKGARLVGVNELEISDAKTSKVLKRDKEGKWIDDGISYQGRLKSKTTAVPLSSMSERLAAMKKSVEDPPKARAQVGDPGEGMKASSPSQRKLPPTAGGAAADDSKKQDVPSGAQDEAGISAGSIIGLCLAGILLAWGLMRLLGKQSPQART